MRSFQLNIYLHSFFFLYLYLALLDGVCLCVNVFYARLFRKVKRRISRSPSDSFFFQSIAYVLSVFSHFFLSVRTFKCDRFSAIPLLHTCRYTHLRGTGNERERERVEISLAPTGIVRYINHRHYMRRSVWSLSLAVAHQRAWVRCFLPLLAGPAFSLLSFIILILYIFFFLQQTLSEMNGCWKRGDEGAAERALLLVVECVT